MNPVTVETPSRSFTGMVSGLFASVKFAVTLVVIITAACVVGSVLPQGTEVAAYLERNPAASGRFAVFGKLGLTHVFHSWWFMGLLAVFSVSVATCSARRLATARRTTGYARVRSLGSMTTHISLLCILAGGIIRGMWGEKGDIEFREGETKGFFVVEKGWRPLPFALHLAKFEIETYGQENKPRGSRGTGGAASGNAVGERLVVSWPEKKVTADFPVQIGIERVLAPKDQAVTAENSFHVKVLQYVPDFSVDLQTRQVRSRSNRPNNPAIYVAIVGPGYQNHRWLFAKFPGFNTRPGGSPTEAGPLTMTYESQGGMRAAAMPSGPIKSFKSSLKIVEDGKVVRDRTVEVNSPFAYKGYTFFQTGYNPQDLTWTSLQVVRDPGVPIVYAGFALMLAGLFTVVYVSPRMAAREA